MKFIRSWSYCCANMLTKQLNESNEKRRVYYYGFQIVIGGIVKGLMLVISSLLFGVFLPTMAVMITFALMRWLAGGYHMDTYGKCIVVSLGMFIASGLVAQHTYSYWSFSGIMVLMAVSFIYGLRAVIKWAPRDSVNKPITKPEDIKKYKTFSIIYTVILPVIITILAYKGIKTYALSVNFALLLSTFIITPAGYCFFDKIKNMKFMNLKKARRCGSI